MDDDHTALLFSEELDADDIAFQLQMQEVIQFSSTSKPSSSSSNGDNFRVFFKGLMIDETVMNVKMSFAGIGVAICDANDRCVFELGKSFVVEDGGGTEEEGDIVELKALIEALNAAVNLGFKRLIIFCDTNSVYQYITGNGQPTNNKITTLLDQLNLVQTKFADCTHFCVNQNIIKFAYKLAKDAITSEATKWAENTSNKTELEQCTICYEFINNHQMFSINKCLHRYCFCCMTKHVEAKLLEGKLPECPYESCKSQLEIESCNEFLSEELYDIMKLRIKEASIPPEEKVYCSFSNCSNLMSKTEVKEYGGMIKCVKCNRLFCMDCKVPWHDDITCSDYVTSSLFQSSNEGKLKSLATEKLWRQCVKCHNMVELAEGCFHIHCRCGYEFCYTCGGEWINKSATCGCPLWDERYIIHA